MAVPLDYGSFEDEYRELSERVAWLDRGWRGRLELTGADRHRLLAGLTSCDVQGLETHHGVYGFFTGPQGKILADVWVLALEDRLWLELPAGTTTAIAEQINKYIIVDQVEVRPLTDWLPISLVGPGAREVLAPWTTLPSENESALSHLPVEILGTPVHCVCHRLAGLSAVTLWIPASSALAFMDELLAQTGLPAAGWRALEAHRIAAGIPAFGHDFTSEHFPQESGREAEGVSYTKGCYLGQEIVARIHYRGGVNRAMCRLRFEGGVPDSGAILSSDGHEVGSVGSAVVLPGTGEVLGLGVIRRQGASPGTQLEVTGGGSAEVVVVLTELKVQGSR